MLTQTQLLPGEFLAEAKIDASLNANPPDLLVSLNEIINEYLAVLPKGTKLLEVKEQAALRLAIPFELKFSNPLMNRVKKVELLHKRDALIENNTFQEFNVLVGVNYYGADGLNLYQR